MKLHEKLNKIIAETNLKNEGEIKYAKWSKKFKSLTYFNSSNSEVTVNCETADKAHKIIDNSKIDQTLKITEDIDQSGEIEKTIEADEAKKTTKDYLKIANDFEKTGAGFFSRTGKGGVDLQINVRNGDWSEANDLVKKLGGAAEAKPDKLSGTLVITIPNVYSESNESSLKNDPRHISPEKHTAASRAASSMLFKKDVVQNWKNSIKGAEDRLKQATKDKDQAEIDHAKNSIERDKAGLKKAELTLKDAVKRLADVKANKHESMADKLKKVCEDATAENPLIFPTDTELADDDCKCTDQENCDCAELSEKDNQAYMLYSDNLKKNNAAIDKLKKQVSDLFAKSGALKPEQREKKAELNKKRFALNNVIDGLEKQNKELHKKIRDSKKNESVEDNNQVMFLLNKFLTKISGKSVSIKSEKLESLLKICLGELIDLPSGEKKAMLALKKAVGDIGDNSTTQQAGFDLTDMPLDQWKELFQDLGLKEKDGKIDTKKLGWVWSNKDIEIVLGCNPFTGEMATATNSMGTKSPKEIGYASYIGIEGNATDVEHTYSFISKNGNYKDRAFGKRNFI